MLKTRPLIFVLTLAALAPLRSATAQVDTWTSVADMPTLRESVAACAVDGFIYAVGGFRGGSDAGIVTNERYDPGNDSWSTMAPMPTGRRMPATAAVDGKCYAIGGRFTDAPYAVNVVEVYDPATNSWATRSRMPTSRYAHTAVVVDGLIYILGGTDGGILYSTPEVYDPNTDTWTTRSPGPAPGALKGAAALNGKVYVMGGTVDGNASRFTRLDIYDPADDSWITGAPLPTGRFSLRAEAVNGRIYAIGGADGPRAVTDVTAYDPRTDSWTEVSGMLTPRARFASAVSGGHIYAIGGTTNFGNPHIGMRLTERYTPLPAAEVFAINAAISDAWFNPLTSGQGLLITVFPELRQMFVAWFTYDTERPADDVGAILGEPGHRWLTAQGPYSGDTAMLTLFNTTGGVFDSGVPAPTTDPGGTGEMTIRFADCENGLVSYDVPSLGISGEIPIERITLDNVARCEDLAGQ